MRETVLADFFKGAASARELAEDVRGSTKRVTQIQIATPRLGGSPIFLPFRHNSASD